MLDHGDRRGWHMDRLSLVLFCLASVLLLSAPGLRAQESQPFQYAYASYDMTITVEADSSMHVQERVTYSFGEVGGWVGIYIPYEYGLINGPQVLNEYGNPLPAGVQEIEYGEDGVTLWYNGKGASGDSTVIYDYHVYEALNRSGNHTGLEWSATPEVHESPIEASSVTIFLPGNVSPSDLELQVSPYNYDGLVFSELQGGNTVSCRTVDIPSNAYYRFSCYWPVSIMDAEQVALAPVGSLGVKTWDFERFDTDITVNPDASLTIRETQVVNFNGSFRFLNRDLSTDSARGIDGETYGKVRFKDIKVYDLDGNTYDGDRWNVESIEGGKRIHIEFEAQDQQLGWIIEYRVYGAIIYYDDYDRLYFNAVSYQRDVPIASSTTMVRLPGGTDLKQVETKLYVDPYNGPSTHESGTDGETLWWKVTDVKPYTTYSIDVSFPKGTVAVPWQYRRSFLLTMLFLSSAFVILTFLLMITYWLRRGRDVGLTGTEMVRYDAPPGMQPAVVGMLMEEKPQVSDISATIVDLARRGYLTIFEQSDSGMFSRTTYGFRKKKQAGQELQAFEREVLEGLFASGEAVTESDLKQKFYVHVPTILDGIRSVVEREGLFFEEPEKVRKLYIGLGSAVILVALAAWWILQRWFDLGHFWLLVPAFVLSGIIVMVVGRAMPRRTPAGSQAYEHAKGFRTYMETAEKEELASMTAENFQENLPYAMVMGVAGSWAAKFEGVFTTPPDWYQGAGTFSAVYLASSLSGMSHNLGSTLTSSPSGSSGGGGGFSGGFGGGFSGGGFGGGGSSAG